jgi:hypothetical protein
MPFPNDPFEMRGEAIGVGRHSKVPQMRERYDVISVPMPLCVKISSKMAWGTRPSMT